MGGRSRLALLAAAVLALASFNLTFRIASEVVTEWDESLYATTAYEMVQSHQWSATTFNGVLDYSNSKPPLNVWLIASAFRVFGVNLISLRLASIVAALSTVLVLLVWAWRRFSPAVGLLSAFVLATCFGFLYVHSGRSANPDALLTLLLLLIVVVLDSARERPWLRAWLGPLLAGVFLAKGMAVLMPALLIVLVEARRRFGDRDRWAPLAAALAGFAVPVGVWAAARWQIDGSEFFRRIFFQDFVALTTTTLDGQSGSVLFYLDILQKHHYDWLMAAVIAVALFPPATWSSWTSALKRLAAVDDRAFLIAAWSVIALLVPTLMRTKLPWYVNPFYPMFALGLGLIFAAAFERARESGPVRRIALIVILVAASSVAEGKLLWYSFHYRPLEGSSQGILLSEAARLRGRRVFSGSWDHSERFVISGLVQAQAASSNTPEDFISQSRMHDYLLAPRNFVHPHLVRVAASGDYGLFRKRRLHRTRRIIARAEPPGQPAVKR